MKNLSLLLLFFFCSCNLNSSKQHAWLEENSDLLNISMNGKAEIIELNKIWSSASHNAFTDLIYHKNIFYVALREGETHTSYDGIIRIIWSADGLKWQTLRKFYLKGIDLRDPILSSSTDEEDKIYLYATGRYAPTLDKQQSQKVQTFTWRYDLTSKNWSEKQQAYSEGYRLYSVRELSNNSYSIGYKQVGLPRYISMFKSEDRVKFDLKKSLIYLNDEVDGSPGEADILFLNDETSISLLRRNGRRDNTALVGYSEAPFTEWNWKDLKHIVGGPKLFQLPDKRVIAAGRFYEDNRYDGKKRTSLSWIDPVNSELVEFLELPSGGDNGYTGIKWIDNYLWVSYYSSHEGKSSIYLAKIKIEDV